ncbi:hypothetical protein DRQ53_11550 [bacterium]|nr:MAG: hypothetical protein DRQ32_02110 [bacterium]RKZ14445.1 MAG: hypothetical protein DRQ53_11550 [bacterium]
MFKKLCAVAFAILAMTATMASAQCTIAAYGDAAGTQSYIQPELDPNAGENTFSFFIVMFAEDTANAAAYKMTLTGTDMFLQTRIAGPSGAGLTLDENPASIGTNVALGECVLGFSGTPILIEEYVYAALEGGGNGTVELSQNTNQNLDFPEYVTCTSVQKDCAVGPTLVIDFVIPTDATSFGSIKSLYN